MVSLGLRQCPGSDLLCSCVTNETNEQLEVPKPLKLGTMYFKPS